MESVAIFLDYANVNRAARDKGARLDYKQLLSYLSEGRFLIDAHCYMPLDPRNVHRLDETIEQFWKSGYVVNTKIGSISGNSYKCNFDIEMTMDILKVAYHVKPAIIVLASGDIDFLPLVLELRRSGIRVEVASFEKSAAHDMVLKCSGFISLDQYLQQPWIPDRASGVPSEAERILHPVAAGITPELRSALIATQVTDNVDEAEALTPAIDDN